MELGTTITIYDDVGFCPLHIGDEMRLHSFCSKIDELWRIEKIELGCITLTLIRTNFLLEKQFNNVLFKMWER